MRGVLVDEALESGKRGRKRSTVPRDRSPLSLQGWLAHEIVS